MKKFLVIVLVLALIPAAIFAKGFSFGLGATASTGATISSVLEGEQVDTSLFNYGAYANIKLFMLSANATLFPVFNQGSDVVHFAGDLAANVAVDIAILRVQAGLSVNYFGATDFNNWEFAFETEDILDAPLNLRAEVDVLLGDLNIGIWGILPTAATLRDFTKVVDGIEDKWQDASLGLAVGFCF